MGAHGHIAWHSGQQREISFLSGLHLISRQRHSPLFSPLFARFSFNAQLMDLESPKFHHLLLLSRHAKFYGVRLMGVKARLFL